MNTRRIPLVSGVLLAVGGLLLGTVSGAVVSYFMIMPQVLQLSLAHELETTGLCANALRSSPVDPNSKLTRLLVQRLDSAVEMASTLADQGVVFSEPLPNLRESVRRASEYYRTQGDASRQAKADALLARLEQDSVK